MTINNELKLKIKEIVDYANKIMEGDADYDGADGARAVIKLNKLYEQSLKSQQEQVLRDFVTWVNKKNGYSAEIPPLYPDYLDAFLKELEV